VSVHGAYERADGESGCYREALLACQMDEALAGDAGEYGALERGRVDRVVGRQAEEVGRAGLLHVLVLLGVEEQHLVVAGLLRGLLDLEARSVVAGRLHRAGALGSRSARRGDHHQVSDRADIAAAAVNGCNERRAHRWTVSDVMRLMPRMPPLK
jgi:hypothetical protein